MNGALDSAKYVRTLRSIVAPRLSELDTNMYLKPFSINLSSVPLPNMAGYKSPCPGGHHSWPLSSGQSAGVRSFSVTFGALFWTNSKPRSACARSPYWLKNLIVSSDVEKEFINMNARGVLNSERMLETCFAMRSKKVLPPVTGNNDLALSKPIPVPRPPFNLRIMVSFNNSGCGLMVRESKSGSDSTFPMALSGIIVDSPETRTPKVYLKAAIAASLRPSAFILASYAGHNPSMTNQTTKSRGDIAKSVPDDT
mmetsp:Transcript_19123/g.51137  ORF Transcript_19123/g.51137 Transcript_19123/m.51137 type:complete len:254 (+) Transcript_19123:782-1543(+)